ncbi:MAG TPA: hypothetical protein VNN10_14850 [Dehalococcoidia bacterium]|nr:hypothetical protein [Dehalococcoidia bacterium]
MTENRTPEQRFLAAVRDHAEARKEMDFQGFLAYIHPEAAAQMRQMLGGGQPGRMRLPRPDDIVSFEVLEAKCEGDTGQSLVRFTGYGSFALKESWRLTEAGWRVVAIERPPEMVKPPSLIQRIKRIPNAFATVRMSRPPGAGPGMMGRR